MPQATLLAIIYLAFISLGLPDSVVGVAWPAMRLSLEQPVAAAGLVTFTVTACTVVSSLANAAVLRRLGTGPVVVISGVLTGLGLLGFALSPSLAWVLVSAVPLGLGAGSVDAGLNHFVADHYSSRHMNWLHACWGVGATIGPLIMGAALLGAGGWQGGYMVLGTLQLALALLFLATLGLWRQAKAASTARGSPDADGRASRRQVPGWAAWLAPALFVVYATAEIGTGLWTASILVEGRGFDPSTAGLWVACFFGAITGGRFAIGLVSARLGNRRLVRLGLWTAIVGAGIFAIPGLPAFVSLAGLVLLGLGGAPIYPSLMHETTVRFAPVVARKVVGRQVAFAALGAAVGPACLGLLGAQVGLGAIMPAILLALALLLVLSAWLDRVT
jgi:fucose permease